MVRPSTTTLRHLVVVFGDQLNDDSVALADFDPQQDAIWMAEVEAESTHVWSHKQRIVLFLSAMRHFRDHQRQLGRTVHYTELTDDANEGKLSIQLRAFFNQRRPTKVICVEPGEHRIQVGLEKTCRDAQVPLEILTDAHFLSSRADFTNHAAGRKELRMEFFYREMRKRHQVLLDDAGKPEGGDWNFDKENRKSFGKDGPQLKHAAKSEPPDDLTKTVMMEVEAHFPHHPGQLKGFRWPVTPRQARATLEDFITHRLPTFGDHQDAMWTGEAFLSHSLLSSSLNLKLLDPRQVIGAAEKAYRDGKAPLAAVEGFIRQILGWREYVRGIYWHLMPEYLERNAMGAEEPLPEFFWTGETPLTCLRQTLVQTLEHGYAHHIQRLMVTGLYTLLLGVHPKEVHKWYLAVYVDAVEWVELPNTLGMSQYADGGVMASKPYVATGKYIDRMSNYCRSCPRNPANATGSDACPFTALYWDYLIQHEDKLKRNPRMRMQLRNLDRLTPARRVEIQRQASAVRKNPSCAE